MATKDNQSNTKVTFKKVFDSRNRRIRGLWQRNGIFYAQLRQPGSAGAVRVRLQDANKHDPTTVPQAVAAMQELLAKRRNGEVVTPTKAPTLAVASAEYFLEQEELKAKRPKSIGRELTSMNAWNRIFGDLPVTKIDEQCGVEFALKMKARGLSGKSIDTAIVAIRNVLKRCRRLGFIKVVPFSNWERMAAPPKRKRLVTAQEIDRMCAAALKVLRDGHQFSDYVRLLSLTGARERETFHLRWEQVDFARGQIEIGRSAIDDPNDPNVAKNRTSRVLPMSEPLRLHLKAMEARKKKNTLGLLFPHRLGGGLITSYRKPLSRVMVEAKVEEFGWHHLRHYFISQCVMSGIDYRTIAEWVGHKDGGVLIGKTYSHLRDDHSQAQAKRLKFS